MTEMRDGIRQVSPAVDDAARWELVLTGSLAAGGAESHNFQMGLGTAMRTLGFWFEILPPPGAASGTHRMDFLYRHAATGFQWRIARHRVPFNNTLGVTGVVFHPPWTDSTPQSEAAQAVTLRGLLADNGLFLRLLYVNETNVAQTNERRVLCFFERQEVR